LEALIGALSVWSDSRDRTEGWLRSAVEVLMKPLRWVERPRLPASSPP